MTTGEQWAAAELDALRAGRFGPGAWWSFLRASFQRAKEARESKPELVSQSRIWSAAGLGIGMTVCAWPRIASPRPRRFAVWWLTTAAMLDWHLGMLEGPSGEPRDRLSTADALTLTRIALVPFLAAQGDGVDPPPLARAGSSLTPPAPARVDDELQCASSYAASALAPSAALRLSRSTSRT